MEKTPDLLVGCIANQKKLISPKKRHNYCSDTSSKLTSRSSISSKSSRSISSIKSKKNLQPMYPVPPPNGQNVQNTQNDIKEKFHLLQKLGELHQQGIKVSTDYNINSPIEQMRNEYIFLNNIREKKTTTNYATYLLIIVVKAIENFNDKYTPLGVKLTGWHASVSTSSAYIENAMGDLYDKYRPSNGESSLSPEFRLGMVLILSALVVAMGDKMPTAANAMINNMLPKNAPEKKNDISYSSELKKYENKKKEFDIVNENLQNNLFNKMQNASFTNTQLGNESFLVNNSQQPIAGNTKQFTNIDDSTKSSKSSSIRLSDNFEQLLSNKKNDKNSSNKTTKTSKTSKTNSNVVKII